MNGLPSFQQWAGWLEQRLLHLEKRQQELEEANKQLKEQLAAMETVRCGDITYKIQELHVKELSGTLNIGLTSLAEEGQLQDMIGALKAEQLQMGEEQHGPD